MNIPQSVGGGEITRHSTPRDLYLEVTKRKILGRVAPDMLFFLLLPSSKLESAPSKKSCTSVQGFSSVGVERFELPTPCSQSIISY